MTALNRSQAAEAAEDAGSNASANPTLGEVVAARFHRRDLLRGALAVGAIGAVVGPRALAAAEASPFPFRELPAGSD